MGIIRAAAHAVGGGLADQWLEVIEPENMGEQTVFSAGVQIRRGENRKRTPETVSNGSVIHVYPNQFMMLVDGGKVVDYTAEEGYYTVQNSSLPSLFNGQFGDALKESFNRVRYGGQTPMHRRSTILISRRSRESSSAHGRRSTILIYSTIPSCFCAHMELTPSRSRIH